MVNKNTKILRRNEITISRDGLVTPCRLALSVLAVALLSHCKSNADAGPVIESQDASADSKPDAHMADSAKDSVADTSKPQDAQDSGDSGDTGALDVDPALACVQGWPTSLNASPQPSLDKTPAVLWKKPIPGSGYLRQIAFSGEKLSVVVGNVLNLMDKDGNIASKYQATDAQDLSAPIVDTLGNFYVGGNYYRSIDQSGKERWRVKLGPNDLPGYQSTPVSNSIMDPNGTVYFAAGDRTLYALRTNDGSLVWKQALAMTSNQLPSVGLGIGDRLFVGPIPVLSATGKLLNPLERNGTPFTSVGGAGFSSFLIGWYTTSGENPPSAHVMDACGKPLSWDFPPEVRGISLIGYSDVMIAMGGDGAKSGWTYGADGKVLTGPATMAMVTLLGGDGTIYASQCADDKSSMDIVAYSAELTEMWRLTLGAPCGFMSPILADDGILYLARQQPQAIGELVAVQTKSPGLAKTAVPAAFHDNRKSGWVR